MDIEAQIVSLNEVVVRQDQPLGRAHPFSCACDGKLTVSTVLPLSPAWQQELVLWLE